MQPQTFAHLFPEVKGVVHTLGTLLESDGEKPGYKESVRGGDPFGLVGHLLATAFGGGGASGNPLAKREMGGIPRKGSYEALNRDAGRSPLVRSVHVDRFVQHCASARHSWLPPPLRLLS
jgi:hypothetical protein